MQVTSVQPLPNQSQPRRDDLRRRDPRGAGRASTPIARPSIGRGVASDQEPNIPRAGAAESCRAFSSSFSETMWRRHRAMTKVAAPADETSDEMFEWLFPARIFSGRAPGSGANDLLAEFLLEAPIDPLPSQFRIPGEENDSRFVADADRYRGQVH